MNKITRYRSNKGNIFEYPCDAIKDEGNIVCPKCNGYGWYMKSVNSYPEHLPDSGFVEQYTIEKSVCDNCDGRGYI
jgi:hypothetical protein